MMLPIGPPVAPAATIAPPVAQTNANAKPATKPAKPAVKTNQTPQPAPVPLAPPAPQASPPATALAYSPDGKTILIGTFRQVLAHDAQTGKRTAVLDQFPGNVHALSFSPDGKWLAVGSGKPTETGTIGILETAGWKPLRQLTGHRDPVNALAWLDNGKRLASASGDKTLRLWNPASGTCLAVLKDHADSVQGLAVSPDGSRICSTGVDRSIKVWDARTGRPLFTFSGRAHADTATALQFSPDGTRLMSAGADRVVRLWSVGTDPDSTRVWKQLTEHGGPVHAASFSPDGLWIATASADKTVAVHNGPGGGWLRTLTGASDWAYCLAFSPDSTRVAAGTYDGDVLEWDLATGRRLRTWRTSSAEAIAGPDPVVLPAPPPPPTRWTDGLLDPDGPAYDGKGMVFVGNRAGDTITRVDNGGARTQQFRRDDTKFTFERTSGQTYFEDNSLFACDIGRNAIVRVYVDQRQELVADKVGDRGLSGPRDLAFDPDGALLVTDASGMLVRFAAGNRRARILAENLAGPTGVALSADAKWVYVAESGTGRIVRLALQPDGTAGPAGVFAQLGDGEQPGGIAFDNSGNLYVAIDKAVVVLDPSGKPLHRIAFPGRVTNVEFAGKGLQTLGATVLVPSADGKTVSGELWRTTVEAGGLPLFRAPRNDIK
jgi:WD40 repeat protein